MSAVIVIAAVSGCSANQNPELTDNDLRAYVFDIEKARSYFEDGTFRSYSRSGNQVDYFAADGTAYRWQQNVGSVVAGVWKVDRDMLNVVHCVLYDPAIARALRKSKDPAWTCEQASVVIGSHRERAEGDLFDLRSEEVPFRFADPAELTFADIQKRSADIP